MTFKIDADVVQIMCSCIKLDFEIGGIIFGTTDKIKRLVEIKSCSHKNGKKSSIQFRFDDWQLFYQPENLTTIGSWHYHPGTLLSYPSTTDRIQYRRWGKKYIHLIINKSMIALYDYQGNRLYEEPIKLLPL